MKEVKLHLDFNGGSEPSEIKACFDNYSAYLNASAERFPPSALAYAQAHWHYDTTDPRCPHDSWLQSFQLLEEFRSMEMENNSIELTLLGAYHDGNIKIKYKNVQMYSLVKDRQLEDTMPGSDPMKGHGDWLIDELSLSDKGMVVHTVHWAAGARWQIWCDDLEYEWKPFAEVLDSE